MKTRIHTALALLALLTLLPLAQAGAATVDRIAAVVDGQVITLSEVERRASLLRAQAPRASRQTLLREAMDALVAEKLFEKAIKELGIDVSPGELEGAIQEVVVQNGFDGTEQLRRAVETQGLDWQEYRSTLERQLAQRKLLSIKVRSRVKVSEDEVRRRYAELAAMESGEEEIHASHILVRVPAEASSEQVEAARQQALRIAERARAGADFAELARTSSEGATGHEGGDLGWFRRGEMAPELERAAFGLEAGAVSEPVRSRFGWHILKIHDRRQVAARPFEQVAVQIREKLYMEELEQQTRRYLDEIRKETVISYPIPELAPETARGRWR